MSGVAQHTSRCLACKQDYTYNIEFEGLVKTGQKQAERYMIFGTCPKGHKIRTFSKPKGAEAEASKEAVSK